MRMLFPSVLVGVVIVFIIECAGEATCIHDQRINTDEQGWQVEGTCKSSMECNPLTYLYYAGWKIKSCEGSDDLACCPSSLRLDMLGENTCLRYLYEDDLRGSRLNEPISQRKCREYATTKCRLEKDSFPDALISTKCDGVTEPGILVFGGLTARQGQLPYMALLGDADGHADCGGTLISENFVLTAAHCVSGRTKPVIWVQLGVLQRTDSDFSGTTSHVAETIIHPGWNESSNGYYNDVALLRLNASVRFHDSMRPACLHADPDEDFVSHIATVAGYGVTEEFPVEINVRKTYSGHAASTKLLYLTTPIVDQKECNQKWSRGNRMENYRKGIVSSLICAGGVRNKGVGPGDSGGPLLVSTNNNPYCSDYVVGITSVGSAVPGTDLPTVFSRVAHFVEWIENIVWAEPAPPAQSQHPGVQALPFRMVVA